MSAPIRHPGTGAAFLVVLCGIAIAGYMIAGWTFDESAYMSVITVFGVG